MTTKVVKIVRQKMTTISYPYMNNILNHCQIVSSFAQSTINMFKSVMVQLSGIDICFSLWTLCLIVGGKVCFTYLQRSGA